MLSADKKTAMNLFSPLGLPGVTGKASPFAGLFSRLQFTNKALALCKEGTAAELDAHFDTHPAETKAITLLDGSGSHDMIGAAARRGSEAHVRCVLERLMGGRKPEEQRAALSTALWDLGAGGSTPSQASVVALLDCNADINYTHKGVSLLIQAAKGNRACLAVLLDRGVDLLCPGSSETLLRASYSGLNPSNVAPFMVLATGVDIETAKSPCEAKADCKSTLDFVDAYAASLKSALSRVSVDERVCRGATDLYPEPLKQVLAYLGLSLQHDQVFNASVDGKGAARRALIAGNAHSAWYWAKQHQASVTFVVPEPAPVMPAECDCNRCTAARAEEAFYHDHGHCHSCGDCFHFDDISICDLCDGIFCEDCIVSCECCESVLCISHSDILEVDTVGPTGYTINFMCPECENEYNADFVWQAYEICYQGSIDDLKDHFAKYPLVLPRPPAVTTGAEEGGQAKTFGLFEGLKIAMVRVSEALAIFLLSLPVFDDNGTARTEALGKALWSLSFSKTLPQQPMVSLLLDSHADINFIQFDQHALVGAVRRKRCASVAFLLDHGAVPCPEPTGVQSPLCPRGTPAGESLPAPINLMLLACGADIKNAGKIRELQVAADCKAALDYTDEYHGFLSFILSEFAPVDTRVGRGSTGIYHEPLERVLEYLGLSMHQDQVFNATLDGSLTRRALIPGNAHAAWFWSEKHQVRTMTIQAGLEGGFSMGKKSPNKTKTKKRCLS